MKSKTEQYTLRLQYTAEASKFYCRKMEQLIECDKHELRGYIPDGKGGVRSELPATLMYRVDTLMSADGHRLYEFLIEYDTDTPAEGIYYGCRGITVDGYDHVQEIDQFSHEREIVLPEMCRILNNTFPLKDFSHRFKLPDNVDDDTYWLFWITLNEEEDIKKVGVTATSIIRNVFRRYLNGETLPGGELPEKKFEKSSTCFTDETYQSLLKVIQYKRDDKKVDPQRTAEARETFERFLVGAEHQRLIARDPNYPRAWRMQTKDRVDFGRMMIALFEYLYDHGLINKEFKTDDRNETFYVPWTALFKVFLDIDGNVYTTALKTQAMRPTKSKRMEKEKAEWQKVIEDCLKN